MMCAVSSRADVEKRSPEWREIRCEESKEKGKS